MRNIKIKPVVNKNNGQINFNLPRKKIPKSLAEDIKEIKWLKIKLEGWA